MTSGLKKFFRLTFHYFASLKLAVVTLLSLAVVLAVGTVYESHHDAETAKYYVYNTPWFIGLLGLLGLNVFCSALSRWPWKRHHIGFLVTHLGILILLSGSFITLLKGYEGQLNLGEGQSSQRMALFQNSIFIIDPVKNKMDEVPAAFRFEPPSAEQPFMAKVLGNVLLRVDQYLPQARPNLEVKASQDWMNNPALQVKIEGSRATMEEWIFSREYDRRRLNLGPASLNFIEVPDESILQKILQEFPSSEEAVLWVDHSLIPVQKNLEKQIALGEKKLRIEKYFPQAGVTEAGLENLGDEPLNPALLLTLREQEKDIRYTLFSKFPELPSADQPSAQDAMYPRLISLPPGFGQEKNEVLFAKTDHDEIYYTFCREGKWSVPQLYKTGSAIETGWMDFKFSVSQFLPKAELIKNYKKVPEMPGEGKPPPAIHLSLATATATQDLWLASGSEEKIRLGDRELRVVYAPKAKPLGFELKLDDFIMTTYEGTQDAASFQSRVTLLDDKNSHQQEYLISMNEPLSYGKYKMFQASYQKIPGEPDRSIFSVAYDPGIWVKYAGSLIMVLGIILMFFFKPLFVQKRRAAREAARELEGQNSPVYSFPH